MVRSKIRNSRPRGGVAEFGIQDIAAELCSIFPYSHSLTNSLKESSRVSIKTQINKYKYNWDWVTSFEGDMGPPLPYTINHHVQQ
jgi:hypothetical protein